MSRPSRLLPALLLLLAAAAPAQSGSVTPYGRACRGPALLPDRYDTGQGKWLPNLPAIGRSFHVSAPFTSGDVLAFLLLGKSSTRWKNNALPMTVPTSFSPAYRTGPCLLTSIENLCFGVPWHPLGTSQGQRWLVVLPIPGDSALVGLSFHMQWALYRVRAAGPFQSEMVYSAGARATVGK
jgi:hypothetical protein